MAETHTMAAALDRWEGEGGAQTLPKAPPYEVSDLGDEERKVLERLGAAVVSGWNELPTDVQRTIFRLASIGETYDTARLKAQVARFLHDHKDDGENP